MKKIDFSKLESLLGRIFISFLLFIICLISAEIIYRKLRDNNKILPIGFYKTVDDVHYPRPYVMASAKPNINGHNELGYKGKLPSIQKPENEFRIIMLGGSTVHGGLPTIPVILEDLIKSQNIKMNVSVYNFGAGSSVSRQDMIRIIIDVAAYSPDLIIHYGGGNEFLGNDPRVNYPHRFMFYEQNFTFTKSAENYDWILALALGSQIARDFFQTELYSRLRKKININVLPNEINNRLRSEAYITNLRWMHILSNSIGAKFISFYQPTLNSKEHIAAEESKYANLESKHEMKKNKSYIFNLYKNYKNDFLLIDCSDIFQNYHEEVYDDRIHIKQKFQEIPAKCILENIKSFLVIDKKRKIIKFPPETYFMSGNYPIN